jgi:N-formylglutamate amidohydrolase
MMDFEFKEGSIPLLVSMPHVGTDIPDDIAARMAPCALSKADTDWHLKQLYGFLGEMGASTIAARWSRYVIDLNRPPEDTNLYPGLSTTGLCPVDTFGSEQLYQDGQAPDEMEVQGRLERYWKPYHTQLRGELDRMLALHGRVVLWMRIRSRRWCRAFSRAACRISISAPRKAPRVRPAWSRRWSPSPARRMIFRWPSTAVSRAATLPATTASLT